jgi:uncharacterized protein (TIGR01777 family)
MRLVLAGASGLIGSALTESLARDGHSVMQLVRRAPMHPGEARWAPERGEVDVSVFEGADAAVCLSGAGIGDKRWTDSYKAALLASRVDTVGTVARAVAASGTPVLVSASAVGFYGDTGDTTVTEESPRGSGFLAELCEQWEGATAPADATARVALLRTGLVLTAKGGLLGRLKPIVRTGAAGRLGSGRQFMPWISLADEVAAIRFILDGALSGPLNLTGPAPARNAEFMTVLGRLLHRPTRLPTPGFALRIVLGEFAEDTLGGQRAVPRRLLDSGYRFQHADLESALGWALEN